MHELQRIPFRVGKNTFVLSQVCFLEAATNRFGGALHGLPLKIIFRKVKNRCKRAKTKINPMRRPIVK